MSLTPLESPGQCRCRPANRNIAEEVIANLRADDGTELIVRIEIEATNEAGFGDGKVRTVSENAHTLKFDQSGFEEN